jgi:hypothetical protein
MSDEAAGNTDSAENGSFSRRNALKAGVAVGVGTLAWSGATITSLGGTPAYAVAGCTGVINIDLSGGCRNTDQGSASNCTTGTYGWHPLNPPNLPSGFQVGTSAHPNIPEHTCCDLNYQVEFLFPTNLQCNVVILGFANNGDCGKGTPVEEGPFPGTVTCNGPGSLLINFKCFPGFSSSTHYTIAAKCNSIGAPQGCIT